MLRTASSVPSPSLTRPWVPPDFVETDPKYVYFSFMVFVYAAPGGPRAPPGPEGGASRVPGAPPGPRGRAPPGPRAQGKGPLHGSGPLQGLRERPSRARGPSRAQGRAHHGPGEGPSGPRREPTRAQGPVRARSASQTLVYTVHIYMYIYVHTRENLVCCLVR